MRVRHVLIRFGFVSTAGVGGVIVTRLPLFATRC